jgi:WD40 repeat protein
MSSCTVDYGVFRELRGHEASVTSCGFSPDGRVVFTGDGNGRVRVWFADGTSHPVSGTVVQSTPAALIEVGHDLGVMCAQFSPVYVDAQETTKGVSPSKGGM